MIDEIVQRLRDTVPALKHIGKAVEFAAAVETNPPATPACFVIGLAETPGGVMTAESCMQRVSATVGLVLVVRNVGDKTGAAASSDMETLRKLVRAQVYGWAPAAGYDPLERGQGSLLVFRDGHLWWQDLFKTTYYDRSVL